ncbi:MAG: TRAP transporter substrate-binding protein [Deltaproteobacteria bacterium]|nr:TRAP transporter substrate-binding protein [Deltaproteobacteria bacterium]
MDRRTFLKTACAGAVVAGSAIAGAPSVHAEKKIRWKMVTTWPKNFPGLGTGANHLAKMITDMSGGRLEVKVYGAGEIVPAFESFDAVSRGTAQMGHGASYYWKGKSEAAQFFAAVPFGLNAQEMAGWIYKGGGQELWDEVYSAFNLKAFAAGNTGVQMGGWFNKEINSIDDFKGLKMRMPGLGGEVIKRAGATPVSLPGGEIFPSLQSGAIDATEWVGPYNDLAFGFYKISKYYYWPGWHEPGTVLECFVNKEAFYGLPKDLQAIVTAAMKEAYVDMLAEFTTKNNAALVELVKKHNVTLKRFPDEVLRKMGELSKSVVEEVANKDPMSKKVYDSFNQYRAQSIEWAKIGEVGYGLARALTFKG